MVLSMEKWVGTVAVVTGASSGIGAAIAERLVEEGLKVVGLARRIDRLEELAIKLCDSKGEFFPIQTDMSCEEEILEAFQWIEENLGAVHILINNAGCAVNKRVTESTCQEWNKIIQVNVVGLLTATREAVNSMKTHNVEGHIININSVLGHYVYNIKSNVYPASKHAVTALTETLRLEFIALNLKIKITSISPGLVDTEILNGIRDTENFEETALLKSEDIADSVVYVLSTPPGVQVHELMIRPSGEIMG